MMAKGVKKKKSSMRKVFLLKKIYFIERRVFAQNYKFRNKNDLLCAWRNFKKKSLWYMEI